MERPVRVVVAGFVGLWSMFSLGLVSIACAPAGDEPAIRAEERIEEGLRALQASRPDLARGDFVDALVESPAHPEAAFGLALSESLMLPASDAVRGALQDLGLRAPVVEEELYGPSGILADLARGHEAEVVRRGALDALGLDPDRPMDLRALMARADPDVDASSLAARARQLAAELAPIAGWFEAAAQPGFRMVIPGSLFHLDGDLVVGTGEAAALAGVVRVARAGLLAVGAYNWGSRPLADLAALPDPALADALSSTVWTAVPPGRLTGAAIELRRGVDRLDQALSIPLAEAAAPGTLVAWELLPQEGVDRVVALLRSARQALSGSVTLPDTVPATRLDLSEAISAPPALPIRAFEVRSGGGVGLRTGFLPDLTRGIADPPLALDPEPTPALFAGGLPESGWLTRWLRPVVTRFEADLGL